MPLHDPASDLPHLPETPGVYRMLGPDGELLYVGKAKNLRRRVRSYFEKHDHTPRIRKMVSQIRSIETILTASEDEALLLEQRLIRNDRPKYNIIFRDDKTYSYIKFGSQEWSRVSIYRGAKESRERYFGPYTDSQRARDTLDFLQKHFRLRSCDDNSFSHRARPCVLHQIGQCLAPCVGLVSRADYAKAVRDAQAFLRGEDKSLIADLTARMELASEALDFESAGILRDQIQAISTARGAQSLEGESCGIPVDYLAIAIRFGKGAAHILRTRGGAVVESHSFLFSGAEPSEAALGLAQEFYAGRELPKRLIANAEPDAESLSETLPGLEWIARPSGAAAKTLALCETNATASLERDLGREAETSRRHAALEAALSIGPLETIECFDISHHQGEGAVASCVRYRDGAMRPSEYRRFTISPEHAGDDFASIREAVIRRYQGSNPSEMPSLILIDGGEAQVAKALEALALIDLPGKCMGVSKGPDRTPGDERLIPSWGLPVFAPGKDSLALLLVQMIRDEAHRFAITGNRKALTKKRGESSLLQIPGVGPSKRKALLLAFASARGVSEASVDELARVPGIGPTLAAAIHRSLRQGDFPAEKP